MKQPDNEIRAGVDRRILAELVEVMPRIQIREWFIKIKMSEHGRNFAEIARRHRMSKWYLSGSVQGRYPLGPRIIRALEADLNICLAPFLSEKEAEKVKKHEKKS